MRWVRYIILGLLALVLVTLALANRAVVTLQLLPETMAEFFAIDMSVRMPLFLVIFIAGLIGLLIGFVWEWIRESRERNAAKANAKNIAKLEREVARLRGGSAVPARRDDVLAIVEEPASPR